LKGVKMKLYISLITIILSILFFMPILFAQSETSLLCGLAKQDITPSTPVTMAGYENRKELSQGIHDSLSVRVIGFKKGDHKLILISTDVIGFYSGTADIFRKAIIDKYHLNPGELFLTAIHTHAAPNIVLDEEKGHANNVAYTRYLQQRILLAVDQALNDMIPVQLETGSGSSPVGVNRREVFYDKAGNPRTWIGRNPGGVQDKEVQVLKIASDNRLIGVLFAYAVHSTSMGWENYLISGDVHGLAEQFIEKYLGEGVIAPAVAGASGDIDPWYRVLPSFETKNGWIPEPMLMGTMLGEEVIHVLRSVDSMVVAGDIASSFVTLDLPGKPRGEWKTVTGHPTSALNITAARIGSVAFLGFGCEVLSEIGMAIKAASPFKHTFIITHCNGTSGYLPPQHLYVEQGYEIQSTPFASIAAELVVKQAVKMLHEL
jgi:neutral ceramidase